MRAIVYRKYGSPDVLQLKEVEKPTPRDDEVLIRIDAASANALDWHYMRGTPFLARFVNGLQKPKNTPCFWRMRTTGSFQQDEYKG